MKKTTEVTFAKNKHWNMAMLYWHIDLPEKEYPLQEKYTLPKSQFDEFDTMFQYELNVKIWLILNKQ